jgi:cholesterol oxidase
MQNGTFVRSGASVGDRRGGRSRMTMSTPEYFDAVVIGSGFGGSVMAYRLAEQGLRVCVLERGQEHRPGSFPRAPHLVKDNFWNPSRGQYGMYNVWFFRRLGALVSSGLGGGSLIYANVMLRKDRTWFPQEDLADGGKERWPLTYEDLEPHYTRVEAVLKPQTFPSGGDYDKVVKVQEFREAARRVAKRVPGCQVIPTPLAVTLYNREDAPVPGEPIVEQVPNRYGFPRRTCVLCANCIVGCNHGAKNTLDLNYLTLAEHVNREKTEIRTRCEVRGIQPIAGGKGYQVTYVEHDVDKHAGVEHDTSTLPPKTIICERLVLAAGTMGSSYLMLKNASLFRGLASEHVGTRFSGNGDQLALAMRCAQRLDPTRGPTITHALRKDDALDTGNPGDGRGIYLEDAAFPTELAWMLENANPLGLLSRGARFARRIARKLIGRDPDTDLGDELSDLLGKSELTARAMPLLGMGRDVPDGAFSLDGKYLQLRWDRTASEAYFDGVTALAREVAEELGGTFRMNPFARLFKRTVTVHPLGGCPMGRNRSEGVVDSWGRVFGCPGFVIADGSILPGSVGPNPALTIAAIADRAADQLLQWSPGANWPS